MAVIGTLPCASSKTAYDNVLQHIHILSKTVFDVLSKIAEKQLSTKKKKVYCTEFVDSSRGMLNNLHIMRGLSDRTRVYCQLLIVRLD